MSTHEGDPDDDFDLFQFIQDHGIGERGVEHERMANIFIPAFRVFRVERSGVCWTLHLIKHQRDNLSFEQQRVHLRGLLHSAGIRVHRHEPLFVGGGDKLLVFFDAPGGEIGLGLKLSTTRGGDWFDCRTEYPLFDFECEGPDEAAA